MALLDTPVLNQVSGNSFRSIRKLGPAISIS